MTHPKPITPPSTLLNFLIETPQWSTPLDSFQWNTIYASVLTGRLSRTDLLEALNQAAFKFSLAVSKELHRNLSANLSFADGLAAGEVAACWNFHQEWSWRFACLPHFVAVLRSGGNVELFLGVRELVQGRRAVGVGLVKMSGGWNGY